jgi:hypothetical protein
MAGASRWAAGATARAGSLLDASFRVLELGHGLLRVAGGQWDFRQRPSRLAASRSSAVLGSR